MSESVHYPQRVRGSSAGCAPAANSTEASLSERPAQRSPRPAETGAGLRPRARDLGRGQLRRGACSTELVCPSSLHQLRDHFLSHVPRGNGVRVQRAPVLSKKGISIRQQAHAARAIQRGTSIPVLVQACLPAPKSPQPRRRRFPRQPSGRFRRRRHPTRERRKRSTRMPATLPVKWQRTHRPPVRLGISDLYYFSSPQPGGSQQGREGEVGKGLLARFPSAGDQWARHPRYVVSEKKWASDAARVLRHFVRVWSAPSKLALSKFQ